jgi:ESS family glutamate:Na+ symporter
MVIFALEVALAVILARLVVFRVMGRDYEAAVMASGFCGFMLGTTANALACMGEVAHKWGNAPRAFLVVSLVGAYLIDFVNALVITQFATFFR